jgi:hypothetical protein
MGKFSEPNFNKPQIENIAGYGENAPDAAKFNVSISSREGAHAAQDARREHSCDLRCRPTAPKESQKWPYMTGTYPSQLSHKRPPRRHSFF